MDFSKTDTQRMVSAQLREYIDENVVGETENWDSGENFPEKVYQDLVKMGIIGTLLPEELDGQGFGIHTGGIIMEELGRGDVGLANVVHNQILGNVTLSEHGNEMHKEIAAANARGENKLSFGLTEPDHGSDARAIETYAEKDGDEWVINGEKIAITSSQYADYNITFCRLGDSKDFRAFLVPLDAPGVEVLPYHAIGTAIDGWGQIFFDDVRVPEENMVSEKDAFKIAMETFDYTRPWIGYLCIGCAQKTVEQTIEYIKERETFGKPVATNQGPQFQVAEMLTKLDVARLKCDEVCWRLENGMDHTKDAAMSKWYSAEVSFQVVKECTVLHGHYGYSQESGIGQRFSDIMGNVIADGTPQILKLIIARETFGREYM
ncbi:acyl-CoA dehydrogenase family protein [Haladaptatus sp. ZSTT2]|uniref:acyl-CoA dehydrogenase family protein n=1 Tax=Haladaptatus sp. ZSTT2 TaxID=3120515 RepID=UPI00300E923E